MSILAKYFLAGFFLISLLSLAEAQIERKYLYNQTYTYNELIDAYRYLAKNSPNAALLEYGSSDVGKPMHLFVIDFDKNFNAPETQDLQKAVILINNGIHPGEPEGMDASLLICEEILVNPRKWRKDLENVVITVIPVYNIGGTINRSRYHRANQETPEMHGFRGNARNLDLNRDFVKQETANARAFARIFQTWQPHVFLDTHTTNGADHQYVITLIATMTDKLYEGQANFLRQSMLPHLYQQMQTTNYPMIPYVMPYNYQTYTPDDGIRAYLDEPKVSTGYGALFNTLSFMTENHIYKPFKQRVESMIEFERILFSFVAENADKIVELKQQADNYSVDKNEFTLEWQLDESQKDSLLFRGYEVEMRNSDLTGLSTVYYNRQKPYEKYIPHYTRYKAVRNIQKPHAYIIPQAWSNVSQMMQHNGVEMYRLKADTSLTVEMYRIDNEQNTGRQNNGHFVHTQVETNSYSADIMFFKGDFVVFPNQIRNQYIVQMLEPNGMDSFFKWNFFDEVLEHREYFSPYGFEAKAAEYLEKNNELKQAWLKKRAEDDEFAKSHYLQLRFVYENSPYYEDSYRRYPVARLLQKVDLPLQKL